MAERDIRIWGDPILRSPCATVTSFDASLATLCNDLIDTVTAREGRAGLAANQIGDDRRAFSWFVDGEVGVVVNPRIVAVDGEQEDDEGCLSLPGLWFPLRRSAFTAIEGVDASGTVMTAEGTGLLARCFQHECGHLDGQLYVDLLDGDVRREALRAARRL
jgi:peptide deformylase